MLPKDLIVGSTMPVKRVPITLQSLGRRAINPRDTVFPKMLVELAEGRRAPQSRRPSRIDIEYAIHRSSTDDEPIRAGWRPHNPNFPLAQGQMGSCTGWPVSIAV